MKHQLITFTRNHDTTQLLLQLFFVRSSYAFFGALKRRKKKVARRPKEGKLCCPFRKKGEHPVWIPWIHKIGRELVQKFHGHGVKCVVSIGTLEFRVPNFYIFICI